MKAVANGALPGLFPLFPPTNWWNVDVTAAPVDPNSATFISWIGTGHGMHPDFGGVVGIIEADGDEFGQAAHWGADPRLAADGRERGRRHPTDDADARQLELAARMRKPAIVHTPGREKLARTRRLLALVGSSKALLSVPWPVLLLTGLGSPATSGVLVQILWFFTKAGVFVFGSGLAIVPFLYGGVVQRFQWLTERQFLDAVAVAMITPGPVVITVAFIGYLVAGVAGATAAALGIFLPVYLVVVLLAPSYKRWASNIQLKSFVRGVTAAATGAIAGAVVVLARRSVYDLPTMVICGVSVAALWRWKILICIVSLAVLWRWKIPEPLLIACAAGAGLLLRHV